MSSLDPHGWATRRRQSVRRAALARGVDARGVRIAAVLLDIGGVIIPQLFESVRRPGFPRGPFDGDERYRAVQRGELSERDYWAEVAVASGVDVGAQWREHTYVREDMQRALSALASRVRLVAFTNDMRLWFGERWPARYPVFALFDQLIEASRLGPPKPDPEAFVRAAAAIGEPVERCLFVDDLRANIEGARAVGMRARYFDVRDPAGSLLALLDDLGLADLPPEPGPRGRAVPVNRMGTDERLRELGLSLPALRRPAGNYVGWVRSGDLLFLSGQGADGFTGRLGADMSVEDGRVAARACALNLLAQARDAVGSLDRVARVVKVLGFVACTDDFTDEPAVIDGASDFLAELFGDGGRHARSAIGVQALPRGFAVEVEMVLEVGRTGAASRTVGRRG